MLFYLGIRRVWVDFALNNNENKQKMKKITTTTTNRIKKKQNQSLNWVQTALVVKLKQYCFRWTILLWNHAKKLELFFFLTLLLSQLQSLIPYHSLIVQCLKMVKCSTGLRCMILTRASLHLSRSTLPFHSIACQNTPTQFHEKEIPKRLFLFSYCILVSWNVNLSAICLCDMYDLWTCVQFILTFVCACVISLALFVRIVA